MLIRHAGLNSFFLDTGLGIILETEHQVSIRLSLSLSLSLSVCVCVCIFVLGPKGERIDIGIPRGAEKQGPPDLTFADIPLRRPAGAAVRGQRRRSWLLLAPCSLTWRARRPWPRVDELGECGSGSEICQVVVMQCVFDRQSGVYYRVSQTRPCVHPTRLTRV
ncbi:hypothetical protein F5X97DRAFT_72687 [Nemania serpens]|nr:hypothetical protein F5X97DRAFT_72687 [Nemania serpens]